MFKICIHKWFKEDNIKREVSVNGNEVTERFISKPRCYCKKCGKVINYIDLVTDENKYTAHDVHIMKTSNYDEEYYNILDNNDDTLYSKLSVKQVNKYLKLFDNVLNISDFPELNIDINNNDNNMEKEKIGYFEEVNGKQIIIYKHSDVETMKLYSILLNSPLISEKFAKSWIITHNSKRSSGNDKKYRCECNILGYNLRKRGIYGYGDTVSEAFNNSEENLKYIIRKYNPDNKVINI